MSFDPPRLTVYCGSRHGARPAYAEAARELARCLLRRGLTLVYGGGSVGLMGVIADELLDGGGEVIGVIPDFMMTPELAHENLTEMRVVDSMHTRKRTMIELSGGFTDGKMILEGEEAGPDGKPRKNRITWHDNGDGTVRQHWEQSADGGQSWQTVFDGLYKPKNP